LANIFVNKKCYWRDIGVFVVTSVIHLLRTLNIFVVSVLCLQSIREWVVTVVFLLK